jgi:hypothetical protein
VNSAVMREHPSPAPAPELAPQSPAKTEEGKP